MSLPRHPRNGPPALLNSHNLFPVFTLCLHLLLQKLASRLGSISCLVDLHERPPDSDVLLIFGLGGVRVGARVVEPVGTHGPNADHVAQALGQGDAGLRGILFG